jgi:flagellar hook-associated protein 1 FlgK
MSSLFGALSLGQQGIEVNQYALELTQRNIANVNTPGYTRQRVNLIPGGDGTVGSGAAVTIGPVDEFRDRFLDYRVTRELQEQGKAQAESSTLEQIAALLNEAGGQGLQSTISSFFNSLGALAAAPEDMTLRSQVLVKASDLARDIRRLADRLHAVQFAQDEAVKGAVDEINELTTRIARLNSQISGSPDTSGATSMLRDQRQQALEQLAGLVDLSYFYTESGAVTVSTGAGALLVVADQRFQVDAVASAALVQVEIGGRNVTSEIAGGKLGGALDVRDARLPDYLSQLDELAARLIGRVNAVHSGGDDYNGVSGGAFFAPFVPPAAGSFAGAASSMAVAIADPRQIAAAAVGAGPGSNGNALKLADIIHDKLFESGTATSTDFYSSFVFSIASDASSQYESVDTQRHILTQLENQRDAAAGVSLDEEAVNLIRYQKAFEASARFIQTVNEMTDVLVRMLG